MSTITVCSVEFQSNSVSAFLDLTTIFGDDMATQNQLRTRNRGQMLTNQANVLPVTPNCRQQPCYFIGEIRIRIGHSLTVATKLLTQV